ncbi:F-box only protein 7 isoform X2 [Parambassis ranga]|uniref:F-box only protein 7 isoform X2 n=1 Tax=Parambassis ranga TaxID=210632 RepID=A0A6P7H574_9TELE|nr:F-box only protein 7 isoform X2 [Parambassis ranga]
MKLRVRINKQTSQVELPGEEPSLKDLIDHIRETLLSAHGLSADTKFSLSLNGSELLSDCGQTLASCDIVSGDLVCIVLLQSAAAAASGSSTNTATNSVTNQNQQTASMLSSQPSSSRPAALTESKDTCRTPDSEAPPPVWEPMLCSEAEEGQAPLSLELLYHEAKAASPTDAIMVAGHMLMLETGFIPQGDELRPGQMPAGWRCDAGVYRLQYKHPLCEDSVASVAAVCMGPMLVINTMLAVTETQAVRKLCVNASSYVTNECPGSAAKAFKHLSKLSRVFKDQLAYPLIATAREAMSLPVAFGLPALPPELLLRVLRLLDVRSVVRLSSVSRHFNDATADSTLWRHLYRRDFSDSCSSRSRDTDWKKLYKTSYKTHRELRRAPRVSTFPPFHPADIFAPAPYPHFPPVPGIIGGEYDQRPNLPHVLLPRPRHDPIGPPTDLDRRPFRRLGPTGRRPADVRRGFI